MCGSTGIWKNEIVTRLSRPVQIVRADHAWPHTEGVGVAVVVGGLEGVGVAVVVGVAAVVLLEVGLLVLLGRLLGLLLLMPLPQCLLELFLPLPLLELLLPLSLFLPLPLVARGPCRGPGLPRASGHPAGPCGQAGLAGPAGPC